MKTLLYIDCCIRDEASRTQQLAQSFLNNVSETYEVTTLKLTKLDLKPLIGEHFEEREQLLTAKNYHHPRFDLAHQLVAADAIVIAAPFWDLSFPALLKLYIEACAVDQITFKSTPDGLIGMCNAKHLVYLTTRGGVYTDSPSEQALPYLRHISTFFGVDHFHAISADGMDIQGYDSKLSLQNAKSEAEALAKTLF
ncbi:MAG: flavodoxin [Erysipelothrix sp.]|nr:flavodoxin [Erysipelothrix sp.]